MTIIYISVAVGFGCILIGACIGFCIGAMLCAVRRPDKQDDTFYR